MSSSFLEQYKKLKLDFPYTPTVGFGNENSDYSDNVFRSNNCYYVFDSAELEDCLFVADGFKETGDVDCDFGLNGQYNYDCVDFADSSNCFRSRSFARCYNIWYGWYLDDCHDCFACANLNNKSYCVFNVQYKKDEYEKMLPELKMMPKEEVEKKLNDLILKIPQANAEYVNNVNSDYCDYSYFNRNCYYLFDSANNQDSGYGAAIYESKDCWDCFRIVRGDQLYCCDYSGDIYNCFEATDCSRCTDCYYVEDCSDCHDCFGCAKLSHKSYCILNVQYTKDEYFEKVKELKKELGLTFSKV